MLVARTTEILNPYWANITEPRFSLLLRSAASHVRHLLDDIAKPSRKLRPWALLSDDTIRRVGLAWFSKQSVTRYKEYVLNVASRMNCKASWIRVSLKEYDPKNNILPLEKLSALQLLIKRKKFLAKLIFVEHVMSQTKLRSGAIIYLGQYPIAIWCFDKECFLEAEQFSWDSQE
jgi:hypothetical protein